MAAFQFPDPALQTTVTNPITGSTYQWKEPPGKWVVTVKMRDVGDIIWEGDNPPNPIGDYKLWYSTDSLELYFYYCDVANTCAWVPTSAPITMLEQLDEGLFELRSDVTAVNLAVRENENAIGRTIYFSDSPPSIYDDVDSGDTLADGTPIFLPNELNYKFWYDTDRLELLVLYKDPGDGAYSYVPVSLPLTNIDLDSPNSQVQANSYSNNQQSQAIVVLEELLVAMQEDINNLNNLTEPDEEIYSSVLYIPFTNDQTIYPLELIEKGEGWAADGITGQFMYDVPDKPVHIGFKANQVTMPQFDSGLAIRFTHTSGVMYARIKGSWHSGQVHLNLEEQAGEPFVAGEFITEIAIQDRKFVERAGDTMIGDLKFQGNNKVVTRNIDSGQNSNLELKHNGITRLYVGGSAVSINSQGVLQQEGTEDNHLVTKKYVDDLTDDTNNSISTFETAIKAAGFQLGNFRYRRGSDSFVSGSIASNTSTNPVNITELKIWHTNQNGVQFGNDFYEKFITEKMYIHIRDKGEASYVGRIDGIEMVTNGIKLTLTPLTNEISGSVYYNNQYDVSIGYNKFGIKYPQ